MTRKILVARAEPFGDVVCFGSEIRRYHFENAVLWIKQERCKLWADG